MGSVDKVVVIGGGTGTYTVLSALKDRVGDIAAVVNMVDDGGSTGMLRDELGVLPPGDVRQCLVALSSHTNLLRDLLNYRFESGTFEGHPFGNLLLSVLEKTTGDFATAVKRAGEILSIKGQVIPVTTADIRLCRKLEDGTVLKSQRIIEDSFFESGEQARIYLEPAAPLNPDARAALAEADLILFGPGNFYSSLVPTLLVDGMAEAIAGAKGKRVYVCNLVNKPHQTAGFQVHDFVAKLEEYGRPGMFDHVIYDTSRPSEDLLDRYRAAGEEWVEFDEAVLAKQPYQAIGADLLSEAPRHEIKQPKATAVTRSFIRHDGERLADLIAQNFL